MGGIEFHIDGAAKPSADGIDMLIYCALRVMYRSTQMLTSMKGKRNRMRHSNSQMLCFFVFFSLVPFLIVHCTLYRVLRVVQKVSCL